MAELQHPELGLIHGKANNGVIQFSGIKYASLKHRFSTAELHNGPGPSGETDATKIGAAAIAFPKGWEKEFALVQQSVQVPDFPPQSDTECLNLTITVPEASFEKPLPVFVFVHGGAFFMGSGTWPQYDHAALVRRSVEIGKPIIGVNINYRTGIFGFLTSEELRGAGIKPNNGLRDQRVAFQWVKKYIGGFNGSPEQICAMGQSAGGASATLQLQSEEPLFHRLVDLSGTCLFIRPSPPSLHEIFYQNFCEAHGLTHLSGRERIAAIDNIDSQRLLLNTPPSVPALPVLDGDLLKSVSTFENVESWNSPGEPPLEGLKWCKELFIGDCQFDGNILQFSLGHRQCGIAKEIEESLQRNLPLCEKSVIDSLLEAYGISNAKDDQAAYIAVLELGNDITAYLPVESFARNWPGTAYTYHLNEPNPWDGPFKGYAIHIFDVALLFKNYDHALTQPVKAVGQAFGDSVISFISGETPWDSTGHRPLAYVFGGQGGSRLVEDTPIQVGRRDVLFRYKNTIGFDNLNEAFVAFLNGR
ncbi:uncharacterized protein A1O9_09381 [Exophiala aquamarina CBS 119918]|uniref:Carboxylesterase type B domain-containing protein n=1 Tax=Exophiala aquamarina CBS 119918 TaxID=1182545 RepID=A0A072P6M5_9EURO|nr:uncharacterized protein A1O9_09381 [Exophiala aquamarina CBS 119918]KEF54938.1 hypothetical protein A1O9_09381 [Exophiala aquamarina CBS 119918]